MNHVCPKCGGVMAVSNVLTTVGNFLDRLVLICLGCKHKMEVRS